MADYLRPAIALAPWSVRNNGPLGPQNYQNFHNPEFFSDARTPWARFWIRWDFLQPVGVTDPAKDTTAIPGYPALSPQAYLLYMNLQIQKARLDGKSIVLTLYAFPSWTNRGRAASGPRPSSGGYDYWCPPDNVAAGTATSFGSPYDAIIWYLCTYYHTQNPVVPHVSIDILEVTNEPNLQWWPQTNNAGQKLMSTVAAGMMATARTRTRLSTGNLPIIAGPAVVDTTTSTATRQDWLSFTNEVLTLFLIFQYPIDQYIAWTIHNYGDIRDNTNLARQARLRLEAGQWRGWPFADPTRPYLLATEGGDLISSAADYQRQGDRLQATWDRYRATEGIGMMTNYLTWSDAEFDSGLCVRWPAAAFDAARPRAQYERPALARWANFGTTAPR
jgi:hypothetical protein